MILNSQQEQINFLHETRSVSGVQHTLEQDSAQSLAVLGHDGIDKGALFVEGQKSRSSVNGLRIPRHAGPRFHVMPGRYSTASRASVPR